MLRLGQAAGVDGGWDVCLDSRILRPRGSRCAAYLFGAGNDISFDIALAQWAPHCDVVTIDPTPGLAARLSPPLGAYALLSSKKGNLPHNFKYSVHNSSTAPPNWRHLDVGIGAEPRQAVLWRVIDKHASSGGGYTKAHANYLKANDLGDKVIANPGDVEVQLWSIPTIMAHLGHERVNYIKLDIEGGEWSKRASDKETLLAQALATPGLQQISFELHAGDAAMWFDVYERLMRNGFHLVAPGSGSGVRYTNGRGSESLLNSVDPMGVRRARLDGVKPHVGFRHCSSTNFTACPSSILGEQTFLRPKEQPNGPARWIYDAAWQQANE